MQAGHHELAGGEATEEHAHRRPFLLLDATDVHLPVTSQGGAYTDHADKAGDMHPGAAAIHVLTDVGAGRAIVVEL